MVGSEQPDEELLTRVALADEEAFAVLYERHSAGMLRLIRRLTAERAVAEELLQEAWLAVWQSAGGFRGEASARSWLLGVARRQAHNRLRRACLPTAELDDAADVPQPGPGPEDKVLAEMEFDSVLTQVRKLPAHLREVLDLVLVEQLSYAEVAQVLGIPAGTVKSRMSQVKRRVAEGTRWAVGTARDHEGGAS